MREKDPNKVDAIYKATLKLVLREGFSGLKMSEVAKEAKVATGTLYLYFENKEDLISQLYLDLKQQSTAGILKEYDSKAPFMVNFEKIWKAAVAVQLKSPEAAAFHEQYYRSPYVKASVKQEIDKLWLPVMELIERGKKERLLKDVPTELLLLQIIGLMNELVRQHHANMIKATQDLINIAFEMTWDGIKR